MMGASNHRNTLPVDRGWAWAIAAAGFIAHVLMGVSGQTNSVLFVEILEKFDTSITTGSLMFMCTTLSFSVSSVVAATFILPKIGERWCLILAGLVASSLTISASFAPSIGVFIVFISMKGVAHGLLFVAAISLIRVYFDKYRSRASFIPWCGGSTAAILAPFIIRAVRKEYGISGTYFLLSAVELHYCLAGMLLRPVSAYGTPPVDSNDQVELLTACAATVDNSINKPQQNSIPEEESSAHLEENGGVHSDEALAVKEILLISTNNIDKLDGRVMSKIRRFSDSSKDRGFGRRERRSSYFGSVMTLDSDVGAALEVMLEDITDGPSEKKLTWLRKLYNDASLELWSFRWTLFAVMPGTVNGYLASYIPTISKFQGASLDQGALLVSIMGGVDLVSRICSGFIADSKVLSATTLLVIAHISLGIACHLLRFTVSFATLIPIIIYIGLFIGSRGPLISLMCMEVVGTQKMPQAYSILCMTSTLMGASFNPILAAIVEATGSFIPVLHIIGALMMLCAALTSLIPLFSRLDVKHGRKQAS